MIEVLSLAAALGTVGFLGYIGWVIAMVTLQARGVRRRLPASLRPEFSVPWSGRLDALRDEVIAQSSPPWAFERARGPAVGIVVSRQQDAIACARLRREGGRRVIVDVRSPHPVLRRSRRTTAEALDRLDHGLRAIFGADVQRP